MHILIHMIMYKLVTSCIYISVGCLIMSLWWPLLWSDWCVWLIDAFGCMWFESAINIDLYFAEWRGGKGGCLEQSSLLRRRGTVELMTAMNSWLGPASVITTEVGQTLRSSRCWEASGGKGVCSWEGEGVPLQERLAGQTGDQAEQAGRSKSRHSHQVF